MTDMNSVKSSRGEDRIRYVFKMGNISVNLQIGDGVNGFLKPQVIKYNTSNQSGRFCAQKVLTKIQTCVV